MDVAAVEEDVDDAETVLLAEPEAALRGNADLGAEQREACHQRIGTVRPADGIGAARHRLDLAGLGS
jgi:hypothetical protein